MTLSLKNTLFSLMLVLAGCGGGGGGGAEGSMGGGGNVGANGGGGGSPPESPSITRQPANASVYEGETATFSVAATGTGPLSYQWKKNGAPISGASNSLYTTPVTTLADHQSNFSVDIIGPSVTTPSVSATLTVISAAPSIITAPTAQTVVRGQSAQFSVTAAGKPSLTYQWKKNSTAISGATQSSYSFTVVTADDGSQYSVTVSNSANTVTSAPATLHVIQPAPTDLVITEVSNCKTICWFEIYNPTSSSINLSDYSFRSRSINPSTLPNPTLATTTFTLPNISIAPSSYVIVSGNPDNLPQLGSQNIRARTGSTYPYWTTDGFIEILKSNATVDFVRFGTSTQSPASTGAWNGASVAALPSTTATGNSGKSIVRPFSAVNVVVDSDSAADWISVDWATPGGRNDIGANVADSDNDGIPDSAEVSGGTYAGLDLYAMGARVGMRDIFIELDQMDSSDAGIIPQQAALQKVVDAFSAKNIKLWIDAGTAFSANFSPANFNLGQGNPVVTYEKCVYLDTARCTSNTSHRKTIYDWKTEYMELRRLNIFHYALFANSQQADGSCGANGVAEILGNDLIITLGSCNYDNPDSNVQNLLTNYQAGALMHELGHNLGLLHGGFEENNYKPNYWSIMNYLYIYGLDPDPTSSTAYQRWNFYANATKDFDNLCGSSWISVASPCGPLVNFVIDYSNGSGTDLNENSLYESNNVGRGRLNGSAYADWDGNGRLTSGSQSLDLNMDGLLNTLKDYNDWANLVLPFSRAALANNGPSILSTPQAPELNPLENDRQTFSVEVPTLPRFMRQ
jgi:hypothetical protein